MKHKDNENAGSSGCNNGGSDSAEDSALLAATEGPNLPMMQCSSTISTTCKDKNVKKEAFRKPELQQKTLLVHGQDVTLLCLRFSDSYFFTISDNGKMAAMLQGSTGFEETRADIGVRFLFGDRRREYYLVYARSLLSLIQRRSRQQQVELLLAISIKDESPSFFKEVMRHIEDHFHFL